MGCPIFYYVNMSICFTICNAIFYVPRVLFFVQTGSNKDIEKMSVFSECVEVCFVCIHCMYSYCFISFQVYATYNQSQSQKFLLTKTLQMFYSPYRWTTKGRHSKLRAMSTLSAHKFECRPTTYAPGKHFLNVSLSFNLRPTR